MKKPSKTPRQAGFALIVTLSLMILLTVIAVGMLTLSSISLRSSGQSSAGSTARSNARLAMMLALGDLQVSMGTDTSVSAPASAVISAPARPHLTGVWKRPLDPVDWQKWHWTPSTSGTPDYSTKAGLFKGWLISTAKASDINSPTFPGTQITASKNVVTLVGNPDPAKDLTNNGVSTRVDADKVKVGASGHSGKLAWAVFDESTKAPVHLGDPVTPLTPGTEIASRTAPGRVHADVIEPAKLGSLLTPVNLISMNTAVISAGSSNVGEFRKRFHDFTTDSVGLLTDVANGGLKTDLTSLFEGNTQPTGISPYPSTFTAAMGVPSWTYIRSHYLKYKAVASTGLTPTYTPSTTELSPAGAGGSQGPGQVQSPTAERLLPVISKFQLIFSMVAHNASLPERRAYLDKYATNAKGEKDGYIKHGLPHLVYDPVVTLYNPYDVALKLLNLRVRVGNPPVGFRVSKLPGGDLRNGGWNSLGSMTYATEINQETPKYFTLILSDGTSESSGSDLKLLPGEVKVFSTRVQQAWNWEAETKVGNKTSFFDWSNEDFSNIDRRAGAKLGVFGVEAVPGWDPRAGLQTDHLSYGSPRASRPQATFYPYEITNRPEGGNGFVTIREEDSVQVEVQPFISNPATQIFQLDLLAGKSPDAAQDIVRRYKFNIANPINELSRDPAFPIIKRVFKIGQILQNDTDMSSNYKRPFAMLDVTARTTKDLADSKPWLYNNPVVEGGNQNSASVGVVAQSYDIRLTEISSFASFPEGVSMDPDSKRGYFGATANSSSGSNFVTMYHVPLLPSASLGDLVSANLVAGSQLPRVTHPFGNSRAHPLIASNKVASALMLDHSYLLNDSLWDRYYFSSLATYPGGILPASRSRVEVMTGLFNGKTPALNSRLIAISTPEGPEAHAKFIDTIGDNLERSRQITRSVGVSGPFNMNSTSVDAWRAVLSSLRGRAVNGLNGASAVRSKYSPTTPATIASQIFNNPNTTPFIRVGKPIAGDNAANDIRWSGFRALTDSQIMNLADNIVLEIKKRGVADSAPSFSVAEFVNRRPGRVSDLHCLEGLLQAAIDNSAINADAHSNDSKKLSFALVNSSRKTGILTPEVLDDNSAEGAPTVLTQGDLMMALAPVATVRGDTFKIRAYGEATSADGNTVTASAWCEVVVQRLPEFVDPTNPPETAIASASNINQIFGRRFNIVSFRWLSREEI